MTPRQDWLCVDVPVTVARWVRHAACRSRGLGSRRSVPLVLLGACAHCTASHAASAMKATIRPEINEDDNADNDVE